MTPPPKAPGYDEFVAAVDRLVTSSRELALRHGESVYQDLRPRAAREEEARASLLAMWPGPGSGVSAELPAKVMQQADNDCMRACLATYFGVPIESVPVTDADDWMDRVRDFAGQHGYGFMSADVTPGAFDRFGRGLLIVAGQSPRRRWHAVIYLDGKLWHDPHPEGGGIEDVRQVDIFYPLRQPSLAAEKQQAEKPGSDVASAGRRITHGSVNEEDWKLVAANGGVCNMHPVLYWLDDGKFARAMLVSQSKLGGHLVVDLTTGDGPSVVGKPDWFSAGYVAAYGGLVPECAQEGTEPGQWSFGVAQLPEFSAREKPGSELVEEVRQMLANPVRAFDQTTWSALRTALAKHDAAEKAGEGG